MRRHPRWGERGFTLVEMVVATGLWIVLGGTLLYVAQSVLGAARQSLSQQNAYIALAHLLETWDAESSSALALFIPENDVLGASNSDGHELDFYSRDAARYGHFWAYRWDRPTSTLQRYTYATPGGTPLASDPPISGITTFALSQKLASAVVQPFTNGYVTRDVAVNFGYPGVDGGNAITAVTVGNAHDTFGIELLPGTMTSGFSVVVSSFTPAPTPTPVPSSPASSPTATEPSTPTPVPCLNGQPCQIVFAYEENNSRLIPKLGNPTYTSSAYVAVEVFTSMNLGGSWSAGPFVYQVTCQTATQNGCPIPNWISYVAGLNYNATYFVFLDVAPLDSPHMSWQSCPPSFILESFNGYAQDPPVTTNWNGIWASGINYAGFNCS
jgi:type II secretory pathway pseudopilin PulG